ncbi:unnamed protein product [Didymodactylos carnosus]|uniref:Thioesterase domain-containing protein n=1 Tax=Didymodactylos carnosus TaxID=1234261 RepID=A0A814LAQ1_9BILA|nr:unnamed protein product [Didymodactylos carnosus]CAF1062564.1 unnamed protein product [Didymodactylos carnosus]CAF3764126.1 unnamed protein product [Didymodactylos carnosus]CAF3830724.1 unnamed protein product [Didymodactylos carnosus]
MCTLAKLLISPSRTLLLFTRSLSTRPSSKNYFCDPTLLTNYIDQKDELLRSIVDKGHHKFYYTLTCKQLVGAKNIPRIFQYVDSEINHEVYDLLLNNFNVKHQEQFKSDLNLIIQAQHSPIRDPIYITTNEELMKRYSRQLKHLIDIMTYDEFLTQHKRIMSYNQLGIGKFPGYLDIEVIDIQHGYVQLRLQVRPKFHAPNGYLHAGLVVTFADTACGYGTFDSKPANALSFTTIELKANFLGSVREGSILCHAELIHGGKTTQVWDAHVIDEAQMKTIAIFRCTNLLLYPK